MSSPSAQTIGSLAAVQDLYDRSLFLDAYRVTTAYWTESTDMNQLTVEELVLAGRLARHLGGTRLAHRLLRTALKRDPQHPKVRYFALFYDRRNWLERYRGFEADPDLGGEDAGLRADWFGSQAEAWAGLRDFERAHGCLAHAHALSPQSAWVLSCEASVLGSEDRWAEALDVAERAYELQPRAPYVLEALASSLLNLGRIGESSRRLTLASKDTQSHLVVGRAAWHLCAASETMEGPAKLGALDEASMLTDRLESLAPLADRATHQLFARVRLDLADCRNDHAGMEKWAKSLRAPFFTKVLENLKRNPTAPRIRLPFRPAIQKYNACLPTSIASAVVATGGTMNPDAMIGDITFGGTRMWPAAEWLERHGLCVRFFYATRDVAQSLIRQGIGFIMSLEGDDAAHAVAVIGLDEAAGTLLIHDPNSFRIGACLLDFLDHDSAFGINAMAVVPPEKAALLDQLLPADAEVGALHRRYERAIQVEGPTAARAILNALETRFPEHPTTRLLQVWQAREDGHSGEALAKAKRLAEDIPNSAAVRAQLLFTCQALENQSLYRNTLHSIVETGALPGVQPDQPWIYAPATHVCAYADLLAQSATTRPKARALLLRQIGRQITVAEAWHNLGDLLGTERDETGELLCYRLASCLDPANEHYARVYSLALIAAGRAEESFAWLEKRARGREGTERRVLAWITWVEALEDAGYPERALAVCIEALKHHASSTDLLAFAVPFLCRMGHWEEALTHLERLETGAHAGIYHYAAHHYFKMRGHLPEAASHAEAWMGELPRAIQARNAVLELKDQLEGPSAALRLAAEWKNQHPGHEILEIAYLHRLDRVPGSLGKKYSVLSRRLKRNPEDAWAWRELALITVDAYRRFNDARRSRLTPRIETFIAQCARTAPHHPATFAVHARWHEVRGEWKEALDAWLASIEGAPGNFPSYNKAWEAASRCDASEREAVWARMEELLGRVRGHLSIGRNIMQLLAGRFDVNAAEAAITRWRTERPEDPDVLEAAADLLLEHGHGRTDAQRALVFLEPGVARFPYHVGLALSLAHAYGRLARKSEQERVLLDVLRRHPIEISALLQLARLHEEQGHPEKVKPLLDAARAADPRHPAIWTASCRSLIREGRFDDATTLIRDGLELMPEDFGWREQAIELLMECGKPSTAVEVARDGLRLYPQRASLWSLLGRTLERMPEFAGRGEVEQCLRHCLERDRSIYGASDWLAMVLAHQRRFDEAEHVMQATVSTLYDPSWAFGRLAWIQRQRGQTQEAVEALTQVLAHAPWFLWGWHELMRWLAEDEDWERARTLLAQVPPQLRTQVEFRLERLRLLETAGFDPENLDSEWDELLRDFPENVVLHIERHDVLLGQERFEEAAAVLRHVLPLDPENHFLLARLTLVLARENNTEDAFRTAMRVWFASVSDSTWPATQVWNALQGLGLADRAYAAVGDALKQGAAPVSGVFPILIAHIAKRHHLTRGGTKRFWNYWLPASGVRELLRFLDLAGAFPEGRQACLSSLSGYGYPRFVVRYWEAHREAIEADVESWGQVGRAFLELKQHNEACELFSTWPERKGVQMFMVANYVLSLLADGHDNYARALTASEEALRGLHHDSTAKFLAHIAAEMCIRLGDRDRFMDIWRAHRPYFTGRLNQGEFFHANHGGWLRAVPALGESLEHGDHKLYDEVRGRFTNWRPWLRTLPSLPPVESTEGPHTAEGAKSEPAIGASKRSWGCVWFVFITWVLLALLGQLGRFLDSTK